MSRLNILCPVDFSTASRGALRYAAAVAEHFGARLTLLTVTDPLLAEAAERQGVSWTQDRARQDLRHLLDAVTAAQHPAFDVEFAVATGKPAMEILKRARADAADVIVMSSRGYSGIRKLFFGATTERVLRETAVPVLVTPPQDPGPASLEALRQTLHTVLVPLDVVETTSPQIRVARAIAAGLDARLLMVHVVEPVWFPTAVQPSLVEMDQERRHRAQLELAKAAGALDPTIEALTLFGDPADEIAKVATVRQVGLIVMRLHGTSGQGPRMGSVTYRVLCLVRTPTLALPPGVREWASLPSRS